MFRAILVPFFFWTSVFAKDFGTLGHVFPIEEDNLLEFLQKEMPSKSIQILRDRVFEIAQSPSPVQGIEKAKRSRSFTVDLTFKVSQDIRDSKGGILAKAGTLVNPLEKIRLSSGLLFLDGSNEAELEWARKQPGKYKWILIAGRPIDLEAQENRPIYFDQAGRYVARFQIEHTPAKVTQKEKVLLVEEFALRGIDP